MCKQIDSSLEKKKEKEKTWETSRVSERTTLGTKREEEDDVQSSIGLKTLP